MVLNKKEIAVLLYMVDDMIKEGYYLLEDTGEFELFQKILDSQKAPFPSLREMIAKK